MVPRILLGLALLTLSGCGYMAARQRSSITSNPPGASIHLFNSLGEHGSGTLLGTTPYQDAIQQGLRTGYLRADLAGYEPATWTLPNALKFSHRFELEPAISAQVAGELASYPREYVSSAVDVLGKCDETLAAPRLLVASAAASANTANERLKLDYPALKGSVLARQLDRAIDELRLIDGLSSASYASSGGSGSGRCSRRSCCRCCSSRPSGVGSAGWSTSGPARSPGSRTCISSHPVYWRRRRCSWPRPTRCGR
jgi:hypothetical protein